MSCECKDENFLNEYRKHECLWNPYHVNFHDCFAKTEALKKITKALNCEITTKDCLRVINCIREKYNLLKQEKIKSSKNCCEEDNRPKWYQIIESMHEKIANDEERKNLTCNRKKREPVINTLFRHTIPSNKCNRDPYFVKANENCNKGKKLNKDKKRRNGNNCKGKLDRRSGCCGDVEKTETKDNCRSFCTPDCTRPQTSWGRQRNNCLDNLTWTTENCANAATVQCPAYDSHINRINKFENICQDPCASTGKSDEFL